MRRRFLDTGIDAPSGAVPKASAQPGYICISNGTDIYFMPLASWQAYSGTEYQAIGVTVSPVGSCGDNYVRVCSITYMDCFTPDVGSKSANGIYWNGYYTTIGGGITETTDTTVAKKDYNGKKNTTAILAKATDQPNWRTDSTIINNNSYNANTAFPAACCCWRYHTLGTNQGDWYLPAAGELWKAYQNKASINPSIQALDIKNAYSYDFWSSTSYDFSHAWVMSNTTKSVNTYLKYYNTRVLAFTRF